jgi:hypothetical protein
MRCLSIEKAPQREVLTKSKGTKPFNGFAPSIEVMILQNYSLERNGLQPSRFAMLYCLNFCSPAHRRWVLKSQIWSSMRAPIGSHRAVCHINEAPQTIEPQVACM